MLRLTTSRVRIVEQEGAPTARQPRSQQGRLPLRRALLSEIMTTAENADVPRSNVKRQLDGSGTLDMTMYDMSYRLKL
jgi:hypothetical protein